MYFIKPFCFLKLKYYFEFFKYYKKYFPLICFLFGVLLYSNTINHGFVLDDIGITINNSYTKKGLSGIGEIFSHGYWHGFIGKDSGAYRPLPVAIMAVIKTIFGFNSSIYHFFNIVLYGATGLLLFKTLEKIFSWKNKESDNALLSFIISLLFIGHPIHTEVVANIKSIDEILCFLFLLLSISAVYNYEQTLSKKHLFLLVLYYFLALLSKETAVTFLAIIPLGGDSGPF